MEKILIAIKNMNIGGVEKSLLSLLGTLSPAEYEIDLLLLEQTGGFMDQIPSWVHTIVLDEYDEIKEEVNLPPLYVIIDYFKCGRIERAFKLGWAYVKTKLTSNYSHYYRAVFKHIPRLAKHYDTAISYTSIIGYLTWFVMYHVAADKKYGWIHFDVSKLTIDKKFMLKLHQGMDKIFVVSQQAEAAFTDAFPSLASRCQVRYNLVDAVSIRKMAEEHAECIRQEGVSTIVTLGRLSWEKGQDIIPEVACKLRDEGIAFKWYLIGDGKLRAQLEKEIEEYGLNDTVILMGTKANPYPYLKQADLYVQPSVYEGHCVSILEVIALDLPIVATDFTGVHEQLDGRRNSRIVNRSADALAGAIIDYTKQKGNGHAGS